MYELFDTLTLLADGHPIFVGPAKCAIDFYEAAGFQCPELRSAPDHLLHTVNADFDLSAKDNITKLAEAYASSPTAAAVVASVDEAHAEASTKYETDIKAPSGWQQTMVLTERALLNNKRDPIIFWLRCVMFAMLCICIGLCAPCVMDVASSRLLTRFPCSSPQHLLQPGAQVEGCVLENGAPFLHHRVLDVHEHLRFPSFHGGHEGVPA